MTNTNKGFVLGYTLMMSVVILCVITGIIYLLSSRQSTTFHIKYTTIAKTLAESGIQHALAQLRQNSVRTEGLKNIKVIVDDSNPRLKQFYEVAISTFIVPSWNDQMMVSATSYGIIGSTATDRVVRYKVNAYMKVNTLSDYFEISTKTLQIGRGLDIANADIYGYNLVFLDGNTTDDTRVNKADYFNRAENATQSWVEIGGVSGGGANQLSMKIDLPLLDEIIDRYKELAETTVPNPGYPEYNGVLGDPLCTKGYGTSLSGDIYPPANGLGVYYSRHADIIIGDPSTKTYIHGQMIFVTTHSILINGDIIKCTHNTDGLGHADSNNDGYIECFSTWGSEYAVPFASINVPTSMVGLLSGGDVEVMKLDAAGFVSDLTVHAVVMASQGAFKVVTSASPSTTATFTFLGSIMIQEGIMFSQAYVKPENRTYLYDTELKLYELPHMPYTANIVFWEGHLDKNTLK